jgi:hypothetical protein
MKSTKGLEKETTENPGCSKNMHLLHTIICYLLLLGGLGEFLHKFSPIGLAFMLYGVIGAIYSSIRYMKLYKLEKITKDMKKLSELDNFVLNLAKQNKGVLMPSILSLHSKITVEQSKALLDTYVERGIAQVEVTDEGIMKYIFPELLEK